MGKILITALGKNDPYSIISHDQCRTGPTLTLILNYLPSKIIFFLSSDIKKENRYIILEKVITEIYRKHKLESPSIEIIDLFRDNDIYNYSEVLKMVCNELRTRLSIYDRNQEFIFSKTAGTPQLKTALEIFPHLYMDGFMYDILTIENLPEHKKINLLDPQKYSSSEILASISDENFNIKISSSELIKSDQAEMNIQKIFSDLQTFKQLIKNYEYHAARILLRGIFPHLSLGRKGEPNCNWINQIYSKKLILLVDKILDLAIRFLSFQLPTNVSREYVAKLIPELNNLSDKDLKEKIAYQNFQIYKKKSFKKDMILSFGIFLERVRKDSIKDYLEEKGILQLDISERIITSASQEINDYYSAFIQRDECIELSKESKSKPNGEINSFTLPVVEAMSYYLKEKYNQVTLAYKFYQYLQEFQDSRKSYLRLKTLRNSLAHDFYVLSEGDTSSVDELEDVYSIISKINIDANIYEVFNKKICDLMFSLSKNEEDLCGLKENL